MFRSRRWTERAFFDTGGVAHRHATVERLYATSAQSLIKTGKTLKLPDG